MRSQPISERIGTPISRLAEPAVLDRIVAAATRIADAGGSIALGLRSSHAVRLAVPLYPLRWSAKNP